MTNRARVLGALLGGLVVILGLVEITGIPGSVESLLVRLVFVGCLGVAVGAARWAPGVALGAAWLAGLIPVVIGGPILLAEAALLAVLFAAARWGRAPTVVLAGLSVLFAPALALAWFRVGGLLTGRGGQLLLELLGAASGVTARGSRLVLLGLGVFAVPFLAGLVLRYLARAQEAQAAQHGAEEQAQQAREIARLQEEQNRLARDVHDVVGHSLTVILAQAESAQFIDDPQRLKATMQTIATSARNSLQDVRQVLTPGSDGAAARRGGLDELIEQVRSSGHPLVSTEVGAVRPLPPELDAVAYRVLQEMLTNAIKHGLRDRSIAVERHWAVDGLSLTVRNSVGAAAHPDATDGQGLEGMRRRLESVGGRLEVQRREDTFTATASLPVRRMT